HLRGIAGRDRTFRVEGGAQPGERIGAGIPPRPLVDRERQLADDWTSATIVRWFDDRRLDGNDFVDEAAAVDRGERAQVAFEREAVLLFPCDRRFAGVILGDESGAQINV